MRDACHAGPAEVSEPAFALRSGMLSALTQYLTVHVFEVLSPAEGEALIVTALVAHVRIRLFLPCTRPPAVMPWRTLLMEQHSPNTGYYSRWLRVRRLRHSLVANVCLGRSLSYWSSGFRGTGVQGVASDLLGRPLDFTKPAAQLLHAVSLVPMPGAPPKQRRASSTSTSKPSAKPAQSAKSESKKAK